MIASRRKAPARGARSPLKPPTFEHLPLEAILSAVQRVWVEEGQIGQTVRHYYYKLLSVGVIRLLERKNSPKNAYGYVSKVLTQARMNEELPWSAVIDPGRRAFTYWSYDSLDQFIRTKEGAYAPLDIWRGQPRRLEMWVEKDGIAAFVREALEPYRIPVYVAKGYTSATTIKAAADRYGSGKGWTILYGGDFDPSGLDAERYLKDTLRLHGARPEIVRVALTQEQTATLPEVAALSLKKGDSRTKRFIAEYGAQQKGFEIDALPASQLRRMIRETAASYMDLEELQQAKSLEDYVEDRAREALEGTFSEVRDHLLALDEDPTAPPFDEETRRRYLLDPNENDDEGEGEG